MSKVLWLLDRTVEAIAAGIVAISTILVCLNVFYRYVLETGIVWANEIPEFLLIWIAFLGAYLAYRNDNHIAFEMVVDAVPQPIRNYLQSFTDLLVFGLSVIMINLSVQWIARTGGTEIETLPIQKGWFMIILPIAFALIALAILIRIIQRHRTSVKETI